MKKIFMVLGAVALMFVSCTSDKATDPSTYNGPKASVVMNMAPDGGGSSATGKNVKRPAGTFAWITSIAVTAKPTSPSWSYSTSETFNLLNTTDTGYSTADNGYIMNNVAVGMNNFVATTTCNTPAAYAMTNFTAPAPVANVQAQLTSMKANSPYAVYAGTTNANIANNTANVVNFNMTTQNGRIMSAFRLADDPQLIANTYATVTASIPGKTPVTSGHIQGGFATFNWSDADAVVGKTVTYTVNVYDAVTPDAVLKTYTISRAVAASTSYSCLYTIDRDQIINTQQDTMTFSWQAWQEVDCANVYDNDGYNCHGYNQAGQYDKAHDTDGDPNNNSNGQGSNGQGQNGQN